ncbi:ATP-binding protein [Terrihabitans rhizophilus]|uniref:ATP-binding protein n=1 Tax=Terrihabitans rhizophilus TaxID=3092662 RepID=A0ABU4RSV7_9HYPH|nr:ATP-binding protein [Terrihabitans sp. PJ23]MDX6807268.1 ATP-binding protein [Terrihabitans sp. PJ23]
MQVAVELGVQPNGAPVPMDLEELLATRLLVQGNSGSGKSHLLRRLLEQSAEWVQQVVIDPEGDFVTLSERYGHVVVDADRDEEELEEIARRIRQHRVSVVLNLEGLDAEGQMRAAGTFLNGLFEAERDHWYPVLVVVDEAQLFAPAAAGDVSDEARKLSLGAMANLMSRGRKRGLAGVIATQRLAKLAKNVAAEASNFLMGRTFLDIDMARAADLLGMDRRGAESFRDLPRGSFVALGPALSRRPLNVKIGGVETSARSTSPKLIPLAEARDNIADVIFAPVTHERPARASARPTATADLLRQLAEARPVEVVAPQPDEPEIDHAARAAGIEAVLAAVLETPEASFRPVAVLYQDFVMRCRIQKIPGAVMDLAEFRRQIAVARAGVTVEAAAGTDWDAAVALSAQLTEDLQGMFLVLARAAMEKAPCPGDLQLARTCGSRSPGRARRLLAYVEEKGLIAVRTDRRGNRVVALPDLDWETAPGRPDAPDEGDALNQAAE